LKFLVLRELEYAPSNGYNGMSDSDPHKLTEHVIEMLNQKNLGFIELNEGFSPDQSDPVLKE